MTPFPDWLEPMAATLTQDRFTGPEWIFERKYDGIRLLAFKQGDAVRLFSRNRLPQNIPGVAAAIAALPVRDAILDGEIDWSRGSAYHIFDVLWLDGRSVTALPLDERRALLKGLPLHSPLHRVTALNASDPSAPPWERACREGWEGVIAKRRDSRYEHKRSKSWFKMKCELTHEFVVGGFTDPQGARVGLGALLVGHHDNGEFAFAGKIGTGFDTRLLIALRQRLDAIEIAAPPFTKSKGLPRIRAHWVKPEVAVRVGFIEWTVHGKLRHPRLLGVVS
jgi:bifunctional non-homologous end joining protein LigD